ncbi:MAG: sporulation protein YqfD [Oscillospiraceae bacterium]|nr:sporulation protein YqfD [Oscillospiraceae bacterium]
MFLVKFFNFIKGYLLISVDGYFLERFINICIKRGIFIWDIHKISNTNMRVKMSVKAFRQIRPIAFRTKSRVRIHTRRGVPFIIHKYRKRRGLLIGLCVFILMMWYFSSFVTGIEITGTEIVEVEVIREHLAEYGVEIGRRVSRIDEHFVRNRMMTAIPEISWIVINIQGSKIYVNVQERNIIPERIPEDVPCNIIATRGGIIEVMNIRNGLSMVNVGDAVNEGDLLVSGVIDSETAGARFVHSFGEVFARTWYEATAEYELNFEERVDTGRDINKRSIRFMNFQINLYIRRRIPYTVYERTRTVSARQVPFLPPLYILTNNFREQTIVQRTRTIDDILILADSELRTQLNEQLPPDAEVTEANMTHEFVSPNLVRVTMVYTVREDIARQVLFDVEATELPPLRPTDAGF